MNYEILFLGFLIYSRHFHNTFTIMHNSDHAQLRSCIDFCRNGVGSYLDPSFLHNSYCVALWRVYAVWDYEIN